MLCDSIRQSALVTATSFGTIIGLALSSLSLRVRWMRLELGELDDLAKLALSANDNLSDNSARSKLIQQALRYLFDLSSLAFASGRIFLQMVTQPPPGAKIAGLARAMG